MNNDVKAFSQALKSRGYFKSGVAAALDEQTTPPPSALMSLPAHVLFSPNPE